MFILYFFFKQKTAYEMRISYLSSAVCSSDLGDSFEVLYERMENEQGEFVKSGKVLFASLTLSAKTIPAYYFERDGDGEYFTPNGEAIRDRKSVVTGKSVSVSVDLGGRRIIKKKYNKRINDKEQRETTI